LLTRRYPSGTERLVLFAGKTRIMQAIFSYKNKQKFCSIKLFQHKNKKNQNTVKNPAS
jgi:hypothetical protein